jgi:hypothetical protein
MQAVCHPDRKMHAKDKCWPCYAKDWHARDRRVKDGVWAEFRREQTGKPRKRKARRGTHRRAFVQRFAGRSGAVTRYVPGTPEYEALGRSR